MSARRFRLELAPRARRDIRSIRLYSLRQWGEAQADAYQQALHQGLRVLQNHPNLGTARDDLQPGLRSYSVQQHRILYRVRGDMIRVLRIVHACQDASHLLTGV